MLFLMCYRGEALSACSLPGDGAMPRVMGVVHNGELLVHKYMSVVKGIRTLHTSITFEQAMRHNMD